MKLMEIFLLVVVIVIGTALLFLSPDPHRFEKGGSHPAMTTNWRQQSLFGI